MPDPHDPTGPVDRPGRRRRDSAVLVVLIAAIIAIAFGPAFAPGPADSPPSVAGAEEPALDAPTPAERALADAGYHIDVIELLDWYRRGIDLHVHRRNGRLVRVSECTSFSEHLECETIPVDDAHAIYGPLLDADTTDRAAGDAAHGTGR